MADNKKIRKSFKNVIKEFEEKGFDHEFLELYFSSQSNEEYNKAVKENNYIKQYHKIYNQKKNDIIKSDPVLYNQYKEYRRSILHQSYERYKVRMIMDQEFRDKQLEKRHREQKKYRENKKEIIKLRGK